MVEKLGLDIEQIARREALWKKGREIVVNAPQLYVDVDIEADGVTGFGSMLALGAVTPTGETFFSEIRPITEDFITANRKFCEAHGLPRERLMQNTPQAGDVMLSFYDWLTTQSELNGNKEVVFSAFNAAFDFPFVDLYFKQAGIEENPFGAAPFDLKSLAMTLNPTWDWDLTKKKHLPRIILPDGDFTHNALEDAMYQQKIHFGLAALLEER